jgi:hypothetical protein
LVEFLPWKTELGAEFLHGDTCNLWHIAQKKGWETHVAYNLTVGDACPDMLYDGKKKKTYMLNGLPSDMEEGFELIQKLGEEMDQRKGKSPVGHDISVLDWLKLHNASEEAIALVQVFYGQEQGAPIANYSVEGIYTDNLRWENGWDNFRLNDSYQRVIDDLRLGLDIRTSMPVTAVRWNRLPSTQNENENDKGNGIDSITCSTATGDFLTAKVAILTAPISCVAAMQFDPPLPPLQQRAFSQGLGMGNVLKVILRFESQPWTQPWFYLYALHAPFAHVWWDSAARRGIPSTQSTVVSVTGYATGAAADALEGLSPAALQRLFCRQLTEALGFDAQACCTGIRHKSWKDHPYALGGYTYVQVGGGDSRRALQQSWWKSHMAFAGEASSVSEPTTASGALQEGLRAAQQVSLHLLQHQTKL